MNAPWPANRVPPDRSSGPRLGLHKVRVLVVDDDDDARDLLRTVLEQRDAQVTVASSAAEAYATLANERPDVLVSDIAMPEEDGYTLIRRVRALPESRGGRTPAIAVTAYAGAADRRHALDSGFDHYLSKPVDLDELVEAILSLSDLGP